MQRFFFVSETLTAHSLLSDPIAWPYYSHKLNRFLHCFIFLSRTQSVTYYIKRLHMYCFYLVVPSTFVNIASAIVLWKSGTTCPATLILRVLAHLEASTLARFNLLVYCDEVGYLDSPIILLFRHQNLLGNSDGFTPGGAEYKGVKKRAIFDQ